MEKGSCGHVRDKNGRDSIVSREQVLNTRKDMRRKNKSWKNVEMKMQEIETVQEEKLVELKGFFEKEKQELEEMYEMKMQKMQSSHEVATLELEERHENEKLQLQNKYEMRLDEMQSSHETTTSELEKTHEDEKSELKST